MIAHTALALWPLWIALIAAASVRLAYDLWRLRRLSRAGINEVDRMTGTEFEERLMVMFRVLGYRAELTPRQGDYGADLMLSKDGVLTAVQAKRHRQRIGNDAVQQALAGREHYGCHNAMVVTNSQFTAAARRQAASARVELWDREILIRALWATLPGQTPNGGTEAHETSGATGADRPATIPPPRSAPTLLTEPAQTPSPVAERDAGGSSIGCRFCTSSRLLVQYGR